MNKKKLFKKSSTTYYYSSLFFPKNVLNDVSTLYAYVRTADNFVDELPQDISSYKQFIHDTKKYFETGKINASSNKAQIITEFVQLAKKYNFKKKWVNAFHFSMVSDIQKEDQLIFYSSRKQLNRYIYGSAEVIGLCMARILQLPKKSYRFARLQGYAMQHINFIRDIKEDCSLKRHYLPLEQVHKFSIRNLCQNKQDHQFKEKLSAFIRSEIQQYYQVQAQAEHGYHFIPYRYRVPIATAGALYKWTAKRIYQNPLVVFEKKIKPNKYQVMITFFKQALLWL